VIALPFWLVVPFELELGCPQTIDSNRTPLAFACARTMAAFLEQDCQEQWYVRLVAKASAAATIEELRTRGIGAIQYFYDGMSQSKKLTLAEVERELKLGD
jgi:hypothetical protein